MTHNYFDIRRAKRDLALLYDHYRTEKDPWNLLYGFGNWYERLNAERRYDFPSEYYVTKLRRIVRNKRNRMQEKKFDQALSNYDYNWLYKYNPNFK